MIDRRAENQGESGGAESIGDIVANMPWRRGQAMADTVVAEKSSDEFFLTEEDVVTMYTQVNHGMTVHFNLTPTATLIVATIASLSIQSGWAYISQEGLARLLNINVATVNINLDQLLQADLIEKGTRHPRWRTIQWRPSPRATDYCNLIAERRKRKSEQKARGRKLENLRQY